VNWIEDITATNISKLLSRYDRLPLVSQSVSIVIYIQLVIEWSRSFCGISHRLVHFIIFTHVMVTEGTL